MNLRNIIFLSFIATSANSLNCYVTNSAALDLGNYEASPLKKNCGAFINEINATDLNANDLRCFLIVAETGSVNIVVQGCSVANSCGQIMKQVELYSTLDLLHVTRMTCGQCGEDLCNREVTPDGYKKHAIVAIVATLVATVTVVAIFRLLKTTVCRKYQRLNV